MKNNYADHLEKKLADNLHRCNIKFIHESQDKEQGLDFYLPDFNVYIEVKQFHADRISRQCALHDNVIVLQGSASVDFFCITLLNK